mmetsp:Transcript_160477/g.510584  ORF Transcript_160477/g.510584 Transcript_160477/m.510584 type:complete len:201 (+) Transcript_160477:270-872(+)
MLLVAQPIPHHRKFRRPEVGRQRLLQLHLRVLPRTGGGGRRRPGGGGPLQGAGLLAGSAACTTVVCLVQTACKLGSLMLAHGLRLQLLRPLGQLRRGACLSRPDEVFGAWGQDLGEGLRQVLCQQVADSSGNQLVASLLQLLQAGPRPRLCLTMELRGAPLRPRRHACPPLSELAGVLPCTRPRHNGGEGGVGANAACEA